MAFSVAVFSVYAVAARQNAVPRPKPIDLRSVAVSDVDSLGRLFADKAFDWPVSEGATIPPIAVTSLPPDLDSLPPDEKKSLFFRALLPIVLAENRHVAETREHLVEILARGALVQGSLDAAWVAKVAERYRVDGDLDDPQVRSVLLRRVDIVPVDLALAQAANESGWGTSRFALEGNNLFGQWTWRQADAMVPSDRPEGSRYGLRVFRDLRGAVRSYVHNLNVGHAYIEFRRLRARLREQGEPLNAMALAWTLERYSSRGTDYVREIRSMIRTNGLNTLGDLALAL